MKFECVYIFEITSAMSTYWMNLHFILLVLQYSSTTVYELIHGGTFIIC